MNIEWGGMFEGVGAKDKLIGWSIIAAPLLLLFALGSIFLRPEPLRVERVIGCYVAIGAPSLSVQPKLIRIGEPEGRTFSYVVEPSKQGYRFAVGPALSLRPMSGNRYAFVRDQRGVGYFWPLLATKSDDPRDMRSPDEFGGRFQILATDGNTVVYTRTSAKDACRW